MLISELEDKKILLLGFGREGQDSFLFLRKRFPEKSFGIADAKEFEELSKETQNLINKDNKVILYFADSYLKQLHAYDVIIKSPGIPVEQVKPLLKNKQILTSQTNLFFSNCPGQIIGVTGTKGKSTTSALIFHVLKAAKKNVHLVGNIGEPVLQFLDGAKKDDIFVYELSSFQLEILDRSPHIAIFLNLYAEHLDRHKNLKEYAAAKSNITRFQSQNDYLIFNDTDEYVQKIAESSLAHKIPFKPSQVKSSAFAAPLQPVLLTAKLFGIHKEHALKSLTKFKPLPHRLHSIGTHRGITFYDDSLATIPEATTAALTILGKNVHTLIAGGYDRGIPQSSLAAAILKSNIRTLVLFPETGKGLWSHIEKANPSHNIKHFSAADMKEAVKLGYENTPKGSICLLSPAASSFNMFQDYKDRGEQFQKFVNLYGKKAYT
jgi:UDP-N-acetylmuramoyl-L-alanine---L-glutamate ligase